jgi:DNA-binding MarR family transcriptional regulator
MKQDMAGPEPLTPRQNRAVAVIQDLVDSGIGPSLQQIASAIGIQKSGAHRIVSELQKKGWVTRRAGSARSIKLLYRLTAEPHQAVRVIIEALVSARPSGGFVHITIPVSMIDSAAAAYGIERAG